MLLSILLGVYLVQCPQCSVMPASRLLFVASRKIVKMLEISCSSFDPRQKVFRACLKSYRPTFVIELDCSRHQPSGPSATEHRKLGKISQEFGHWLTLTTKPPTPINGNISKQQPTMNQKRGN